MTYDPFEYLIVLLTIGMNLICPLQDRVIYLLSSAIARLVNVESFNISTLVDLVDDSTFSLSRREMNII